MHEMSLADEVFRLVEATARRESARRVRRIILEIGRLSAVEPAALRVCLEAVCRGSVADGAVLDLIPVDGAGWCADCARTVPMDERPALCPHCGSLVVRPVAGTEMRVREIEIES